MLTDTPTDPAALEALTVVKKAADDMRALCAVYSGHRLHQEADRLMCDLMRAAGYGDAVDVFLEAVGDYHSQEGKP